MEIQEEKYNILKLDPDQLESFLIQQGFKKFRASQINNWIWNKKIIDPDKMTNIPAEIRNFINPDQGLPLIKKVNNSDPEAVLILVELQDKNLIEMVIIDKENHYTLCVSTGVGCPLKCKFCATGKMPYKRQLTSFEIIWQMWLAQHYLISQGEFKNIRNVVMMGMGEPFLDPQGAVHAAQWLADKRSLNMGQRRITISTAGVVPGINYMAKINRQFRLAVSLNAVSDRMRRELMPVNKKWNLDKLLGAVRHYVEATNRAVTFEYVMLKSINDQPEHAAQLIKLIRGIKCKVNLIPYNQAVEYFQPPTPDNLDRFQNKLKKAGVETTVRLSSGKNIKAGCGQLAGEF